MARRPGARSRRWRQLTTCLRRTSRLRRRSGKYLPPVGRLGAVVELTAPLFSGGRRRRIVAISVLLLVSAAIAIGASLAYADDARELRDFATLALGREHEQTRAGRIIKWVKPVRVGVLGERRSEVLPLVRLHVPHLRTITGHDIRTVSDGEIDIAVIVVARLDRANVAVHADV